MDCFLNRFLQSVKFGFHTSFKKVVVVALIFIVASLFIAAIFGGRAIFEILNQSAELSFVQDAHADVFISSGEFDPSVVSISSPSSDVVIEAVLRKNAASLIIGYILFIILGVITATYVALVALTPKATIKELLTLTRKNTVRYLLAGIVSAILMMIPYILGIVIMMAAEPLAPIGALVMMAGMAFVAPLAFFTPIVALQEQIGGWRALTKTRQYVKGNFWRAFWNIVGFMFLSMVLMWIIFFIVFIATGVVATFITPLITIPVFVLYILFNYLYQASMFHFLVELLDSVKHS